MDATEKEKERWVDLGGDLIEAYRNLITLKVVEHASRGASVSVMGLLSLFIVGLALLFAGLGAAWWLGEYLQNMKAGFFAVGAVYVLLFALLIALSPKVLVPRIRNFIIKKIYEQN